MDGWMDGWMEGWMDGCKTAIMFDSEGDIITKLTAKNDEQTDQSLST